MKPASPPHQTSIFFQAAAVALLIAKAAKLTASSNILESVLAASDFFYSEFSFLGIFFLGLFIQSTQRRLPILLPVLFLQGALLFWYFVDTLVILMLTQRASLVDLYAYSFETGQVEVITKLVVSFGFYVILAAYAQRFRVSVPPAYPAALAASLLLLASLGLSAPSTGLFTTTAAHVRQNFIGSSTKEFTNSEIAKLGAAAPLFTPQTPSRKIILLLIESFSTCDSKRSSGLCDHFPNFDKISNEGILFRNFFANGTSTELGLVSLLAGTPPLVFPGYPYSPGDAYRSQDSIPRFFRNAGFTTAFLSSASLTFRAKRGLLAGLGFERFKGLDETEAFRTEPRFAFDAVSDEVLYAEALKEVQDYQRSSKPFFLVLETTSSHLPYVDPLRRGDNEENVLNYVDNQFALFYSRLKDSGFFEDGLLIVTGDHRKMLPVSEAEWEKYGVSAESRVPLLFVGKDVPPGVVDDRVFQQADLFRFWPSANQAVPLSLVAYHVAPYTPPLFGANQTSIRVISGSGNYSLSMLGSSLSWADGASPPDARLIEQDLIRRAARLQYCFNNAPLCTVQTNLAGGQRPNAPGPADHPLSVKSGSRSNSGGLLVLLLLWCVLGLLLRRFVGHFLAASLGAVTTYAFLSIVNSPAHGAAAGLVMFLVILFIEFPHRLSTARTKVVRRQAGEPTRVNTPHWLLRRTFPERVLQSIGQTIENCEKRQSCELCFTAEFALPPLAIIAGQSPEQRADELFSLLRLWDTEQNNAVLLYLLLAKRRAVLVCDRSVKRALPPETLAAISARIEAAPRKELQRAIEEAIVSLTEQLEAHFGKGSAGGQISNMPVLL